MRLLWVLLLVMLLASAVSAQETATPTATNTPEPTSTPTPELNASWTLGSPEQDVVFTYAIDVDDLITAVMLFAILVMLWVLFFYVRNRGLI